MEWHKNEAINNFNQTWELIDKKDRSKKETLNMIHKAHASLYHWSQVGTPLELARGEWQISRVYAISNMGESALYHAQASLDYCLKHDYGDFDLAFAYEAIARAHKIIENNEEKEKNLFLAKKAAEEIEKEDDKKYFLKELGTI